MANCPVYNREGWKEVEHIQESEWAVGEHGTYREVVTYFTDGSSKITMELKSFIEHIPNP